MTKQELSESIERSKYQIIRFGALYVVFSFILILYFFNKVGLRELSCWYEGSIFENFVEPVYMLWFGFLSFVIVNVGNILICNMRIRKNLFTDD